MKRKRSTIRRAKNAILKAADELERAGIDVSQRDMVIGGQDRKAVQAERDERKTDLCQQCAIAGRLHCPHLGRK